MAPKAVTGSVAGNGNGNNTSDSAVKADDTVRTMIASSMAGMIARIPMHPIDTCKAKIQVQTNPNVYRNFVDCLVRTYRAEGVRGLYPGFGVTFLGSGPAMALYWTSYETAKSIFTHRSSPLKNHTFAAHFSAGLVAECFSCVLWVPIDVVKERLQVQSNIRPPPPPPSAAAGGSGVGAGAGAATGGGGEQQALRYRGNLDAIAKIWRYEGLRGVYKGYFATVASFGPFSAIYLSSQYQHTTYHHTTRTIPHIGSY